MPTTAGRTLLTLVLSSLAATALAQPAPTCPPAFGLPPDAPWCETLQAGPDRMRGTADDQPDCAANLQQDCAQTAALSWSFDDGAFCQNCPAVFYVVVDCSPEIHLPFDDMEAAAISVTDMSDGAPVWLVAENEAWRRELVRDPLEYCDGCANPLVSAITRKDLPVGDKPAGSCTSAIAGTFPEVPGLPFRDAGFMVGWGTPIDRGNPDSDRSGIVEQDEMEIPPCTSCTQPDCLCGTSTDANRVTEAQIIDVTLCGDGMLSGVYRIEILSGGFVWELMANSTGELEPEFMIYSRCDEALAAWTAGAGAQLALHPDPAIAVQLLDDTSCPAEITLAVTTCNIGSEPADSAPFSVEFDDGSAPPVIPPFFGDNGAHPSDPACLGPLAAGECRSCEWVIPLGGAADVFATVTIDPDDLVDECNDAVFGSCSDSRRVQRLDVCGTPSGCNAWAQGSPAPPVICLGETSTIDASGSWVSSDCAGVPEYRYESPAGTVLPGGDWSPATAYDWTPGAEGAQDMFVSIRCSTELTCLDLSSVVTVTVGPDVPLDLPGAVTAAPDGDCALRVTWNPATGADGVLVYDLYRADATPVPLTPAALVASDLSGPSYLDEGWLEGVHYRVVARDRCEETANAAGDSDATSSVDTTPPDFEGVVDTRDLGFCEVEILWDPASDDCSGVASFNVYRDHGVGNRGETLVASDVPGSPYIDTTPGNGTWVYVVRSVDAAGNEDPNDVFQQESENSCTNDFPEDAGMDDENGVDPPNGDGGNSASAPVGGGIREWGGRIRRGAGFDELTINWNASPSEFETPHVVTYSVLRGTLSALHEGRYDHELTSAEACGIPEWSLDLTGQEGGSFYYLVVPVGGDNATYGYDSSGSERPEAPVCF